MKKRKVLIPLISLLFVTSCNKQIYSSDGIWKSKHITLDASNDYDYSDGYAVINPIVLNFVDFYLDGYIEIRRPVESSDGGWGCIFRKEDVDFSDSSSFHADNVIWYVNLFIIEEGRLSMYVTTDKLSHYQYSRFDLYKQSEDK